MHTSKQQQQGAVLLISLLVLLVLTLIGLSSLDGSVMEEKMATNAQTATATFQAAESAIRETFYAESQRPALAVAHARAGNTTDRSAHHITSSTQMAYPSVSGKAPSRNSSSGNDIGVGGRTQFTDYGIEITGNANVGNIQSRTTQGYSVGPLPSM